MAVNETLVMTSSASLVVESFVSDLQDQARATREAAALAEKQAAHAEALAQAMRAREAAAAEELSAATQALARLLDRNSRKLRPGGGKIGMTERSPEVVPWAIYHEGCRCKASRKRPTTERGLPALSLCTICTCFESRGKIQDEGADKEDACGQKASEVRADLAATVPDGPDVAAIVGNPLSFENLAKGADPLSLGKLTSDPKLLEKVSRSSQESWRKFWRDKGEKVSPRSRRTNNWRVVPPRGQLHASEGSTPNLVTV